MYSRAIEDMEEKDIFDFLIFNWEEEEIKTHLNEAYKRREDREAKADLVRKEMGEVI